MWNVITYITIVESNVSRHTPAATLYTKRDLYKIYNYNDIYIYTTFNNFKGILSNNVPIFSNVDRN